MDPIICELSVIVLACLRFDLDIDMYSPRSGSDSCQVLRRLSPWIGSAFTENGSAITESGSARKVYLIVLNGEAIGGGVMARSIIKQVTVLQNFQIGKLLSPQIK